MVCEEEGGGEGCADLYVGFLGVGFVEEEAWDVISFLRKTWWAVDELPWHVPATLLTFATVRTDANRMSS